MIKELAYLVAFILLCQTLIIIFYKKHKRYVNYGNDTRSSDDYIDEV